MLFWFRTKSGEVLSEFSGRVEDVLSSAEAESARRHGAGVECVDERGLVVARTWALRDQVGWGLFDDVVAAVA